MPPQGHERVDGLIEEAHGAMASLLASRDQLLPSEADIASEPSVRPGAGTWDEVTVFIRGHLADHADSTQPKLWDADCFEVSAVRADILAGLSSDDPIRGARGDLLYERSRRWRWPNKLSGSWPPAWRAKTIHLPSRPRPSASASLGSKRKRTGTIGSPCLPCAQC